MPRKTKLEAEQISPLDPATPIETPVEPDKSSEEHFDRPVTIPPKADLVGEKADVFNSDGELVVDVFETEKDFVVLAAIAGIQIKDLDISIEKDMMVIKGHREDPHDHPEKKYFYQECYWGPFSRKIVLPENIDTQSADAQMDKGMLTVKIPKLEPIAGRKKNIQVG